MRLRVNTTNGSFGRTVTFKPGFNVVRGGNSRGKTQVIQAIVYTLGLERMLQARANTPLGSALTSEIRVNDDEHAPAQPITSSWVAVELETADGQIVTAQRHPRHSVFSQNLVRVWHGPALTDPANAGAGDDLFLHQSGSASRDHGFHKLLSDLLGWDLPEVATYSGDLRTLYLDVIFPFLLVDQQSWGTAGPRKVERYQIREPQRKATEFLLSLTGPGAESRRAELEQTMNSLRTRWAASRTSIETLAGTVGGRIIGVPEHAAGGQARSAKPQPTSLDEAGLQVLENGEWIDVDAVLGHLAEEMRAAREATERTIAPGVDARTQRELQTARSQLGDLIAAIRLVEQDQSLSEAQLAALDRRLSTLFEERDRNTDIRTLVRLGSQVAASHMADHNCPTCRQSLDAVESEDLGPALDVEQSLALLNAQITTTQKMRDRAQQVARQATNAYAAMQREADQLRTTVRALEADILAPAETPSTGDIARQVTLELRHSELLRIQAAVAERLDELTDLAAQIADTRVQLNELPSGVPDSDTQRVNAVASEMRRRLATTRFDSYDVDAISLDQDSFQPARSEFDINTDVSASDVVRIKVAYLDAIRAIGQAQGRHPGLLILDEPRQQDIDPNDYAAMLQYLNDTTDADGQVIITSATPQPDLAALLDPINPHVVDLGTQRLLQPDVPTDPLDTN